VQGGAVERRLSQGTRNAENSYDTVHDPSV
jgi:hypothetical protein